MKLIYSFFFIFSCLFCSSAFGEKFTPSKNTFIYKSGATTYQVNRKLEHQPFIQTLIVNYRCSKKENWKKHYVKYGYCKILNVKLKNKKKNFFIKVIQEADMGDDNRACLKKTTATIKLSAKDLCSNQKMKIKK